MEWIESKTVNESEMIREANKLLQKKYYWDVQERVVILEGKYPLRYIEQ